LYLTPSAPTVRRVVGRMAKEGFDRHKVEREAERLLNASPGRVRIVGPGEYDRRQSRLVSGPRSEKPCVCSECTE
jgi:hypothetical protein